MLLNGYKAIANGVRGYFSQTAKSRRLMEEKSCVCFFLFSSNYNFQPCVEALRALEDDSSVDHGKLNFTFFTAATQERRERFFIFSRIHKLIYQPKR